MIYLYSGTPGSGKSMHQAECILNQLKRKRLVIANYDISDDVPNKQKYFIYLPNERLKPDTLIKISNLWFKDHKFKEGAITLFIDESQLLFNSREWDKPDRRAWLSFFTQHRKYGYDVVLVAQFDRMLDRQIRSLIEYNCVHRMLKSGGWRYKFLSLFLGHNAYVCVIVWYPMKTVLSMDVHHVRKKYYRIYDSYKHFEIPEKTEKNDNKKKTETGVSVASV